VLQRWGGEGVPVPASACERQKRSCAVAAPHRPTSGATAPIAAEAPKRGPQRNAVNLAAGR
jgi:hypothetical protein